MLMIIRLYFTSKNIASKYCNILALKVDCNTTCSTKHATSIAVPVAILKSIVILVAIFAILQY